MVGTDPPTAEAAGRTGLFGAEPAEHAGPSYSGLGVSVDVGEVVGGVVVGGVVVGVVVGGLVVGFDVGGLVGFVVWVAGGFVVGVASVGGTVVGGAAVVGGTAVGVGRVMVTLGATDWLGTAEAGSDGSGASVVGSDAGGATATPSPQLSGLCVALTGADPAVTPPVDTTAPAGSTQNQDAVVVLTSPCPRATVSPSGA